ncbi:hypothetical protein MXAN_3669 [Myxococcus xanthus DK 1622]|uniref:Uncharacterized protein n=1 Tax=Myxococcus xanthus (strain DK1622) TaxID=246197 RepID=Q1D667_MYXXD|nr:hypothetical protein MXAN_3669 [Myxococcus xanthus DK 1622]
MSFFGRYDADGAAFFRDACFVAWGRFASTPSSGGCCAEG